MARVNIGIMALVAKIGSKMLPIITKLVKTLKVGKMSLAVGSMATYAYIFTWQFAAMVMVLLFVHESGHIWAMKRCGLKTKGIYFVPLLGAAAVSDEMFKSRRDETYIAIMGPIWGFGVSVLTALIYFITNNALFAAAAGWMALINLFNLLPINPLDGGRIVKSISFSIDSRIGFIFLIVGIVMSVILTFLVGLILFSILLLIACLELFFEYRMHSRKKELDEYIQELPDNVPGIENHPDYSELKARIGYLSMPPMTRKGILASTISYVIVVGVLWALMSYMSHIPEVEVARAFFMS